MTTSVAGPAIMQTDAGPDTVARGESVDGVDVEPRRVGEQFDRVVAVARGALERRRKRLVTEHRDAVAFADHVGAGQST